MPASPPISPTSQTTTVNVYTADYTVSWSAPVGGPTPQVFSWDDGGAGGTFSPASPLTTDYNLPGFTFKYKNPVPGTYTLTLHYGAGPLSGTPDATCTAIVVAGISAALVSVGLLAGALAVPVNISASLVSVSRLAGAISDPAAVGGNPGVEWEVRLYDTNGKRMRLPQGWIDSAEFEIAENGGMQTGTLQIVAEWETLQLAGNERVDIWVWGVLVYRGWVRIPHGEINPERKSPTLYGLMEVLNGYRIGRNLCYATSTSFETIFTDIVNGWVKRTGRLPSIVIDVAGVSALGLTLPSFDGTGKNVTQALNDLVAIAPGSLIWGCDVNSAGVDRIYLRPRSAAVKYKFAVGEKVQAFVYPQDVSQVKNAVFVTGGELLPVNLAPNASFEKCNLPGELTANLLLSPSFEDAAGGSIPNWIVTGNPTSYASASRTGSISIKLDNNPGFEALGQEIYLPALPVVANWVIYARCPAGQVWHLNTHLDLYDSVGTALLGTGWGPFLVPADGLWHRYTGAWSIPVTAGAVKVRVVFFPNAGDSGAGGVDDGLEVDDAALWLDGMIAEGWQPGESHNATWAALDFASSAIPAYDGDLVVQGQASIIIAGGYAEICTSRGTRISVKPFHTYWISIYVSGDVVSPPLISLGVRGFKGEVQRFETVNTPLSITSGLWHLLSYNLAIGDSDTLQLFVRSHNGNPFYADAAGVWEGNMPVGAPAWYPEKNLTAYNTVSDYAGSISAAAAASITAYGLREDAVSNDQILDQATLDAFLTGWFNAHAVPAIQARLTLYGATAPLLLDGTVQIVNIPAEPPALFPSRVRYQIGEAITIEADLGNQRPDLAGLLRAAAQRVLR